MTQEFTTAIRFNQHLGALETLSFVGEGVGAALYITAIGIGEPALAMLGIGFVVMAVAALTAHLGQPTRSWRAVTRFAFAWVSRGSVAITSFVGFSVLAVFASRLDLLVPYRQPLTWVALACAVPVVVYAGMMLRSMKAVRFWRGVFMPLSFTTHSFATAFTLAAAISAWSVRAAASVEWLPPFALACLALCAAASAVHLLLVERSAGTQASLQRLLAGDLRSGLLVGAGAVGVGVPALALALALAPHATLPPAALLAVAAACRLYGDFAYRNSIVAAGAYEPFAPTTACRRSA